MTTTVSTGLCPTVFDSRSESRMKSFLNLFTAAAAAGAAARSTFFLLADLSECTPLTSELRGLFTFRLVTICGRFSRTKTKFAVTGIVC
jgi:hypothetical protein